MPKQPGVIEVRKGLGGLPSLRALVCEVDCKKSATSRWQRTSTTVWCGSEGLYIVVRGARVMTRVSPLLPSYLSMVGRGSVIVECVGFGVETGLWAAGGTGQNKRHHHLKVSQM